MKKRILIAALTAAMASSIFGVTVNAAERELNINWLSSRSASESAILAIQDIAKQYQEEKKEMLEALELYYRTFFLGEDIDIEDDGED